MESEFSKPQTFADSSYKSQKLIFEQFLIGRGQRFFLKPRYVPIEIPKVPWSNVAAENREWFSLHSWALCSQVKMLSRNMKTAWYVYHWADGYAAMPAIVVKQQQSRNGVFWLSDKQERPAGKATAEFGKPTSCCYHLSCYRLWELMKPKNLVSLVKKKCSIMLVLTHAKEFRHRYRLEVVPLKGASSSFDRSLLYTTHDFNPFLLRTCRSVAHWLTAKHPPLKIQCFFTMK